MIINVLLLLQQKHWKFPVKTDVMNQIFLKQKIKNYLLSYQWPRENDSPIFNCSIDSIMISLEEEILVQFGLPPSAFQYTSLMESYGFSDGEINQKVNNLYRKLKNEAIAYLSSDPESDFQILNNGRIKLQQVSLVLPFLGYGTTEYNSFIYHDIFCLDLCSADELLEAITTEDTNRFNNDSELIYPFAKEYKAYKTYKHNCSFRNLPTTNIESIEFESSYHEGSCLIVDSFFILSFVVRNPQTCIVDIVITHDSNFLKLQIWCTVKQLFYILYHARYRSDIASPMLALRYNNYDKGVYAFNPDQKMNMVIEIPKIDIEFERLDRKTDVIKTPYSFIISYIDPILDWNLRCIICNCD
jgi:hypothetical protein